MRLCEAPHFDEERPRRVPPLAAAAQTPAVQQRPPPSPGPAAAAPQPRGQAAPSPAKTAPGGGHERGHKDPRRRLSADRCVVCFRRGREPRGGPAGGPLRGPGSAPSSRSRGVRGSSGAEGRPAPPRPPPPPPFPPFLERSCPAAAGGSVCRRPWGCWHLPLLSGATGLKTGSRASGAPILSAALLVEMES